MIVAVFNCDAGKLIRTLGSVVRQKNVVTEIIISDDHSAVFPEEEVEAYISKCGKPIQIIRNPENLGTVRNVLGAVTQASGKYVFITSPGDYLFDCNTLAYFYSYAEKYGSKVVFGKAVNYCLSNGELFFEENMSPNSPGSYNVNCTFYQQICFFFDGLILGASYFRERETFLKYLRRAAEHFRYTEDSTTTAFYLLEGNNVSYCDRYIVWYESNTGISSGNSDKWSAILSAEHSLLYDIAEKEYGAPFIRPYYDFIGESGKLKKWVRLFVTHPRMAMILFSVRLRKKKSSQRLPKDTEKRFLKATNFQDNKVQP